MSGMVMANAMEEVVHDRTDEEPQWIVANGWALSLTRLV
jgi:hypothetical protein